MYNDPPAPDIGLGFGLSTSIWRISHSASCCIGCCWCCCCWVYCCCWECRIGCCCCCFSSHCGFCCGDNPRTWSLPIDAHDLIRSIGTIYLLREEKDVLGLSKVQLCWGIFYLIAELINCNALATHTAQLMGQATSWCTGWSNHCTCAGRTRTAATG